MAQRRSMAGQYGRVRPAHCKRAMGMGDDQMIRLRTIGCAVAALWLAACADPLSDFDRLSDVPLAEGTDAASVAPGAADAAGAPLVLPGLLAGILGSDAPDDAAVTATPVSAAAQAVADAVEDSGADAVIVTAAPVEAPGFLAGLFGGGAGPAATPTSAAASGQLPGAVQIPGAAPLPPGSAVPYGVIATVCGLSDGALGRTVESISGYTIHDTNPTSTGPRTQYITGFTDGCARQFYGTLALFGDIGTHELVRYSSAAGTGYTATDNAYETIKAAYCGVAARTSCGTRLEALSQRTTFLTIYETFGTSNGWADVLLSDGRVIADDF